MASNVPSRPQTRVPLSRERVLEAAIQIADRDGIESLSMRKLARALNVEAMSLYNHVANKGDLVDAIVDLVVDEIELPSTEDDWDVAIRACAISAHEVLLRHPWACSLAITSGRVSRNPRLVYMDWLLGRLREGGLSPGLTYHAYHTLDSHIFGFTLWQLGHLAAAKSFAEHEDLAELAAAFAVQLRADGFRHVADHAEQHAAARPDDGAREFEFGLDLILDGLKNAAEKS